MVTKIISGMVCQDLDAKGYPAQGLDVKGGCPMPRSPSPTRLALAVLSAVAALGCSESPAPNQPPDTGITAGPPEGGDAGYRVSLAWSGTDPDGTVDRYQVSWDSPDDWRPPATETESEFTLHAADTCCVEGLPEFPETLPDSVWGEWHTFRVRAVDDDGDVDPTPAVRSFNAKTIAPYCEILTGPGSGGAFTWQGHDDDGSVIGYRWAVATLSDYLRDVDDGEDPLRIIAWLDTLTWYPDFGGGYFADSLVWRFTQERSVDPGLPAIPPSDRYIFAVRAVDDAFASERVLAEDVNVRFFQLGGYVPGPTLQLHGGYPGARRTSLDSAIRPLDLFADTGFLFHFRGRPGDRPLASLSYSLDGGSWTAATPSLASRWITLPAGNHQFRIVAVDDIGRTRDFPLALAMHERPSSHAPEDRYVLLLLDTDPQELVDAFIWPPDYATVERALFTDLLDGYPVRVFETHGTDAPPFDTVAGASAVIWVLSATTLSRSLLEAMPADAENPVAAYRRAGGPVLLFGLNPSEPCRRIEHWFGPGPVVVGSDPVDFIALQDDEGPPHWFAEAFGLAQVQHHVRRPDFDPGLGVARSAVTSGANPYPDLPFDPLSWPGGPGMAGFGYFDTGLVPVSGSGAEVLYTRDDTGEAVAIRRVGVPGEGSTIWMGFHPYFVERPACRAFLRAALTDFGVPAPGRARTGDYSAARER